MLMSGLQPAANHPLQQNAPEREQRPSPLPEPSAKSVRKPKSRDFSSFYSFPNFDMLRMMYSRKGVAAMLTPEERPPAPAVPTTRWQRLKQAIWSWFNWNTPKPTEEVRMRRLRSHSTAPNATSGRHAQSQTDTLNRLG